MNWRYRFCFLSIVSLFLIIVVRLFYWQVVKAEELSLLGQSQYGRVVKVPSIRGEIKTSDGFSIATNKVSYLIFANPKEINDKDKTSLSLKPLLEQEEASISALLSMDRYWIPLKTNVDNDTKERIEKLKLDGIGFEQQYVRFYPEASLAAHLIGFVGKDTLGDDKGYFGLEGYYDRQLKGKSGKILGIYDALGRPIFSKIDKNKNTIDGRTLNLSIDRVIQFIAEKKLKEGIERYGAEGGMVGIINPKTGEILAMSGFPAFDSSKYNEFPEKYYKNPFISNAYEPGSTFKPLIMAGALDLNLIKPETVCTKCSGPVSIGGYEIKTWNNKYHENINMVDVIRYSDNTGMVFISELLGLKRMMLYIERFGIGKITGIDLQGEVAPEIKSEDQWYPIDVATASFGQGISVTPIELLTAFTAIANEGKRMQPHVVSKIETPDGKLINIQPEVLSKPISGKTAKIITEVMVNAVNLGESKWTKLKGYRVAGKTGTAQIPIAGHYDPNKTITSFIGFAPADDPKFLMLVIVDRPTKSIYGSETAAPIFFDIARDILAYYGIEPTEN